MALIKQRFGIDPVLTPGATGQFDILVDGKKIAQRGGNWISRKFGSGYPELNLVADRIEEIAKG